MKMNKFFMGILGALALTGCSNEDVPTPTKPIEGEGVPRYMSVTVRNSNPGTRAGGDQTTVDGGKYEEGYESENKVTSLRFYFFDDNGKPIAINTSSDRSYFDCDESDITDSGNTDMGNTVEKILNAVIVINSADSEVGTKIKKMMAVANFKSIENKLISTTNTNPKNLSLSELKGIIGREAECNVEHPEYNGDGFLLTNSSYVDAEGNIMTEVEIKETDIKESKESAMAMPVDVYVERVVAKVRVKTVWTPNVITENIIKEVTYKGNKYEAIPLYTTKVDNVNGTTSTVEKPITVDDTENGDQVYVIFTGWNLWWTAQQTYLFKTIGANWHRSLLGDWCNSATFKRSFWAQNPEGTGLNKYPHTHATKKILTSGDFQAANVDDYAAYCLENAGDDYTKPENFGLKKTYDPDTQTTPRTLVYLGGVLVTVKDGVATELPLVEWAAKRNTENNMIKTMFSSIQNELYFRSADPVTSTVTSTETANGTLISGSDNHLMIALTAADIHFVSGEKAGLANQDAENSPRYMSYLNLNPEDELFVDKIVEEKKIAVEKQLYRKAVDGSFKPITIGNANQVLQSVGGAKVWKNGAVYYYHEIEHLNTTDTEGTKGKYGVVRNHIYEIEINSIYGLGTPVLTPENEDDPNEWEDIVPQHPSHEYFLGARLNILAWRVVGNNVKLDW